MAVVTAEMIKTLREKTGVGMAKCKEALEQAGGDLEKAIDILRKAGMASAVKKEGRDTHEGLVGFFEDAAGVGVVQINSETDFVAKNERFQQFLNDMAKEVCESKLEDLEKFLAQKSRKDASMTIDEVRSTMIQSLGENIQITKVAFFPKSADRSIGTYSHMGGKVVSLVVLKGATGLEAFAKEIAMHVAAESPDYLSSEQVPADVRAREEEVILGASAGQLTGKPTDIAKKIIEGKLKAFYEQVCLLTQKYIKDNSLTIQALVEKKSKEIGKPLEIVTFLRWKTG